MKKNAVYLRDVGKYYAQKGDVVNALRGVDLTIPAGDFAAIAGPLLGHR